MHYYLLIFVLITNLNIKAQVADSSLFSTVKSINPGVIHSRYAGQISITANKNTVNKKQTVTSPAATVNSETILDKYNFFRGGRGKGLTSEIVFDLENGNKTDEALIGKETLSVKSKSTSNYLNVSASFGKWIGVSISQAKYQNSFSVNQATPININSSEKSDLTYMSYRFGKNVSLFCLSIGAFYDVIKVHGNISSQIYVQNVLAKDKDTNSFPDSKIIGAGLACSWSKGHIEFAYEGMPDEADEDIPDESSTDIRATRKSAPPTPSRISAVIEFKIYSFKLGVKTSYIKNNFLELGQIISSKMLYGNMSGNSRLENSFNFAFGNDKGFSVGGSFSKSSDTRKETSDLFGGKTKYNTEVTSTAYGINLGYVF